MKFPKLEEAVKAYEFDKCDTFTSDVSQLYALRLNLTQPSDQCNCPTSSRRSRWHPWCGSATTTG